MIWLFPPLLRSLPVATFTTTHTYPITDYYTHGWDRKHRTGRRFTTLLCRLLTTRIQLPVLAVYPGYPRYLPTAAAHYTDCRAHHACGYHTCAHVSLPAVYLTHLPAGGAPPLAYRTRVCTHAHHLRMVALRTADVLWQHTVPRSRAFGCAATWRSCCGSRHPRVYYLPYASLPVRAHTPTYTTRSLPYGRGTLHRDCKAATCRRHYCAIMLDRTRLTVSFCRHHLAVILDRCGACLVDKQLCVTVSCTTAGPFTLHPTPHATCTTL